MVEEKGEIVLKPVEKRSQRCGNKAIIPGIACALL